MPPDPTPVLLEPATAHHVRDVVRRMRPADREEVLAGQGRPGRALVRCLRLSAFARVARLGKEGEVAAMFGVRDCDRYGVPWLVTTTTVDRYPLTFWRASKIILREIRALYPVLVQNVDTRHAKAISWAERLGFTIAPAKPYGPSAMPFHPLVLRG